MEQRLHSPGLRVELQFETLHQQGPQHDHEHRVAYRPIRLGVDFEAVRVNPGWPTGHLVGTQAEGAHDAAFEGHMFAPKPAMSGGDARRAAVLILGRRFDGGNFEPWGWRGLCVKRNGCAEHPGNPSKHGNPFAEETSPAAEMWRAILKSGCAFRHCGSAQISRLGLFVLELPA